MNDPLDVTKNIPLFNTNIGPLGGVLALGYHVHALTIPVIRKTSRPAHYERDISLAFGLVFLTYSTIGVAGMYGFLGTHFEQYLHFANAENYPIS